MLVPPDNRLPIFRRFYWYDHTYVAKRLKNRVQLTTDGHKAYLNAVEDAFGANVDFAQLIMFIKITVEAA